MSSYVARVKKQDTLPISQIIPDAPSLAPPPPPRHWKRGLGQLELTDALLIYLACFVVHQRLKSERYYT